jgi:hypothetical protein
VPGNGFNSATKNRDFIKRYCRIFIEGLVLKIDNLFASLAVLLEVELLGKFWLGAQIGTKHSIATDWKATTG